MLIGSILAIFSAALYGIGPVLARIGMRRTQADNGHFMMALVTVLVLGAGVATGDYGLPDPRAIIGFVGAGLLTNWLGRDFLLRCVRLIGPTKQGSLVTSSPVFSAIMAWVILREGIAVGQAVGGMVIVVGVLILLLPKAAGGNGTPILPSSASQNKSWASTRLRPSGMESREPISGYILGLLAAALIGIALVVRKWALQSYPEPVAGAFIGGLVSFPFVILSTTRRGVGSLLRQNFRPVPWWFVGAGVAVAFALGLQFIALTVAPTWLVSLIQGSQGAWTYVWSWTFLGAEEPRSGTLLGSLVLVTLGAWLIALSS